MAIVDRQPLNALGKFIRNESQAFGRLENKTECRSDTSMTQQETASPRPARRMNPAEAEALRYPSLGAVIILEHPPEALAAFDYAVGLADFFARVNEPGLKPVMMAHGVIARYSRTAFLAEKDRPVEALFRDRSHDPLRMSVEVWRARWQQHRSESDLPQQFLKLDGELCVSIQPRIARVLRKAVFAAG
jgi:hypothetical protein